jgi:hypothetical protein
MIDATVTAPRKFADTVGRDPLMSARLSRTEYGEFNIRNKRVNLDAATVALLSMANGLLPLEELGRRVGLSPSGTLEVGKRLLELGYLSRPPQVAPVSRDPLSPEMRDTVRKLRPILVRFAGNEAAFALEVDAPKCKDLADLVVCMRRRFTDPGQRDQFTAAVMSELCDPPVTRRQH